MSLITASVNDARASLDEETGEFSIEVRLANGAELRFASQPDPQTLASLRAALTGEVKKKRRRRRRRSGAPQAFTES